MSTALSRPAVLVYAEYASLSTTPSTPELNVCVVGPCYQILDYPEDLSSQTLVTYSVAGATSATSIGAASGSASVTTSTVLAINGVKAGAVVDTSSVKVTLVAPTVEVLAGACTTITASPYSPVVTLTAVDAVATGVAVGDTLILSNAAGTINTRNTIRSINSATSVTMNNQSDATAYTKFRIERVVSDVAVTPTSVTSTTVTLPALLSVTVGGLSKLVIWGPAFVGYRALRTDLADVYSYNDVSSAQAALGKYDARNPLCVGATVALSNTNTPISVYGITSDDATGYTNALSKTTSRRDLYAFVPLTTSISVQQSFVTSFNSLADPTYASINGVNQKFRIMIGGAALLPTVKILDDANLTGVAVNTAAATPTSVHTMTLATANFVTNKVLPGDTLTITLATPTSFNGVYTVSQVLSETSVEVVQTLTGGTATAGGTGATGVIAGKVNVSGQAITSLVDAKLYLELTDTTGTFYDSGIKAGDFVEIPIDPLAADISGTSYTGATVKFQVATIESNQHLTIVNNGRNSALVQNELPHGYGRALVGGVLENLTTSPNLAYRITRTLGADDQVTQLIAAGPSSLASRRGVICWPDLVDVVGLKDGSLTRPSSAPATALSALSQPSYYLACAVGGLISALPSHHGLTRMGIAGISKIYNSNTYFTDAQITKLSNNGYLLFQQDTPVALPYCIHSVTTDTSALQFGELMMVKNFDYVAMVYQDAMDPFIGKWNINPETIGFVSAALNAVTDSLRLDRRPKIGSRINGAAITQITTPASTSDRLEVHLQIQFPSPLNTVALYLISL